MCAGLLVIKSFNYSKLIFMHIREHPGKKTAFLVLVSHMYSATVTQQNKSVAETHETIPHVCGFGRNHSEREANKK